MNYLERTCCLCLSQEQNVTSQSDIGSNIQEMFEYIVPEHAINKSAIPRKICDICSSSLNNIFEFRQRCLKSIRTYNEYVRNLLKENESCKYSSELSSIDMLQNVKCELLEDVQHNDEQKIEEQNFHKELKIETLDTDYDSSIKEKENEMMKEQMGDNSFHETVGDFQIKKEIDEELIEHDHKKDTSVFENSMMSSNAKIHDTIQHEHSHNMETFENKDKQSLRGTSNDISDSLPTSHIVRIERGKNRNSVQKLHSCNVCQKSFTKLSNLKSHIRTHTGDRPFSCDVCQKAFSHLATLKEHKRIHSDEKTFICDICQEAFRHCSSLKIHKYTHSGQRPISTYNCDLCEKTFRYHSSLKEHKRVHSGDRLHCDVCLKAFTDSSNLRKHKLIHSGQRPYTCQVCQKSFRQLAGLNYHELVHTGEKPHSCEVCQQSFARRDNLLKHKRRIHSVQ